MSDFHLDQYKSLIGKTIRNVIKDGEGFHALVMDDETVVWVQQDDEANGPGVLRINPPIKKKPQPAGA